MDDDLNFLTMKDDINILENGRRPQFWGIWKTTSIFWPNGRRPQVFGQMEDDLIFLCKWKMTSIFKVNWKKTSKTKTWNISATIGTILVKLEM